MADDGKGSVCGQQSFVAQCPQARWLHSSVMLEGFGLRHPQLLANLSAEKDPRSAQ